MSFTFGTVTPVEELHNRAMDIVNGYQCPRLGRLQLDALAQMHWKGVRVPVRCKYYRQQQVMVRLENRGLVEKHGYRPRTLRMQEWVLTELGARVGSILRSCDGGR